jgi:hypothetical protein
MGLAGRRCRQQSTLFREMPNVVGIVKHLRGALEARAPSPSIHRGIDDVWRNSLIMAPHNSTKVPAKVKVPSMRQHVALFLLPPKSLLPRHGHPPTT